MKFLSVDDDKVWHDLLTKWAEILGIELEHALSGYDAIRLLQLHEYDVIFVDLQMPEMSGVKLIEYIKDVFPVKIVVMSNHPDFIKMLPYIRYKYMKPYTIEDFNGIINIVTK